MSGSSSAGAGAASGATKPAAAAPSDPAAASPWQRTVFKQIGVLLRDGWVITGEGGRDLDDLECWYIEMPGPPDSPYEGGVWLLRVFIVKDFPRKSPSVGFVTPIFHPNIEPIKGAICVDVLNQAWSPATTLLQIMLSIQNLLSNPNGADPYNAHAAALMRVRCLSTQKYGPDYAQAARAHAIEHALRHVARTPQLRAGETGAAAVSLLEVAAAPPTAPPTAPAPPPLSAPPPATEEDLDEDEFWDDEEEEDDIEM